MYIKNSEYFSKYTGAEIDKAVGNNLDIDEKLDLKVDKTQEVNGKALTGNITLNAADVGAEPDITAQNMLSSDLVSDADNTHKFVTTELITQIGTNVTDIQAINSKIPEEASSLNKLTDEAFVNELVDEINLKIPEEATSSNQLADKDFVTNLVDNFVGDGIITITQGGVQKGTFNVNQKTNSTIALESGGGSGGASSVSDLSDVSLDNLSNGQTLIYNSDNNMWENGDSASSVSTLSDVSLDDLEDGQTLVYDSGEQKWVNGNATSVTFIDWTS